MSVADGTEDYFWKAPTVSLHALSLLSGIQKTLRNQRRAHVLKAGGPFPATTYLEYFQLPRYKLSIESFSFKMYSFKKGGNCSFSMPDRVWTGPLRLLNYLGSLSLTVPFFDHIGDKAGQTPLQRPAAPH